MTAGIAFRFISPVMKAFALVKPVRYKFKIPMHAAATLIIVREAAR